MKQSKKNGWIITNANIYTQDAARPQAEALIAVEDRIFAVGSTPDILALAARELPESPVLNLQGQTVLPGFIDAHTHFLAGGFSLQALDLHGCSGPDEFVRRIAARSQKTLPNQWITGGGWDQETWPGAPMPRKEWIDAVTGDIPVFVTRSDLHIGLANSAALHAAGITADTANPSGGEIFRRQGRAVGGREYRQRDGHDGLAETYSRGAAAGCGLFAAWRGGPDLPPPHPERDAG